MVETSSLYALLVGSVVVLSILSEAGLERLGVPNLLGYLVLGAVLREFDHVWNVVPASGAHVLQFLSEFGIIILLFRVGLECNPKNLFSRLPGAALIAVVNIVVSGGLGFVAAYDLIGLSLIPSLFIAVALTATSIGVSTRIWGRHRSLHCRDGEMMIDVAEIDDVSGVILLTLLTALLPYLQKGIGSDLIWPALWTVGLALLKVTGLMLVGLLSAQHAERSMMRLLRAVQLRSSTMLIVLGIALLAARLTAVLGFPGGHRRIFRRSLLQP